MEGRNKIFSIKSEWLLPALAYFVVFNEAQFALLHFYAFS
jgi:hypothetical protein